jgi:GntR family transcriptional regulator
MGVDRNSPVSVADQIATDLRQRIARGEFTGRLPAHKALASEYGVAEMTIQAVMKNFQREGLVTTAAGRGTFVSDSADAATAPGAELLALRQDVEEMRSRIDALERAVGTGGGG